MSVSEISAAHDAPHAGALDASGLAALVRQVVPGELAIERADSALAGQAGLGVRRDISRGRSLGRDMEGCGHPAIVMYSSSVDKLETVKGGHMVTTSTLARPYRSRPPHSPPWCRHLLSHAAVPPGTGCRR